MDPALDIGLDDNLWLAAAIVIACLAVSGFYSLAETAITAVSRPRMHRLAQQGNRRALIVNELLENKERTISALLLGNNVVNTLTAALTTVVLTGLFGDAGVVYATIIVSALVVVFAEVLPKTLAIVDADRFALSVAPSVRLQLFVLGPLAHALSALVAAIMRLLRLGPSGDAQQASSEALRGAIELHGETLATEVESEAPTERAMMRSVLDLSNLTVAAVMRHRGDMELIDAGLPPEEIVARVLISPYTRIPIYREKPDDIVGVVHAKALFRAVQELRGAIDKLDIVAVASKPWFIPESTTLYDQLQAFQARREHFALVVDEYGALEGLITLEDILEEIVGDIADEHDEHVPGVEAEAGGSYVALGSVTVRDLNREFRWKLPEDGATTIGGLVLYEARRIPEVGQMFSFHGFRFEILAREGNRIARLRIVPPAVPAPAAP
jgi:Mg2+/Co2+ transporter CorB